MKKKQNLIERLIETDAYPLKISVLMALLSSATLFSIFGVS